MQDMEVGSATEKARGTSLLENAERKRAERKGTMFLDIPSWDGDLIGEYRLIPPKEMLMIAERVARKFRNNNVDPTVGDIELIVHACVGLYALDPETGDKVPLEDEFGLVGYDRIAVLLGKEDQIHSTSDAVRYLTAERDPNNPDNWVENVTAINRHAQSIQQWMKDPSKRAIDLQELLQDLV